MPNFCEACGSQLGGTETFCWKCGAPVTRVAPQQAAMPQPQAPAPQPPAGQYQQVQFPAAQPQYAPVPAAAAPAAKKSSPILTIVIVVVAVLFVGGALAVGGVLYVAHRVSQKMHQLSAGVVGDETTSSGHSLASVTGGNACRLLSKEEVSRAVGVEIVATNTTGDGCEYLAKGNSADMTSKHMAALMGTKGADSKQQEMIQKLAGGLFSAQQSESKETGQDSAGNTPVFMFSIDTNSAEAQMRLNSKVLGTLGPGQQSIPDIGDQAYDESGAMMLVRKGDKMIRIMYMTCPCTTEAIKPLARKLASAV